MKKRRLAMWTGLGFFGALALFTARPAFHLARVAWRDPPALVGPPPGFVDDANERYVVERRAVVPEQFSDLFQALVTDGNVAMGFGRLSVDAGRFFDEAVLTVFRRDPAPDGSVPPLEQPGLEGLKRAVFRGAEGDEYGKRLRWDLEKRFGQHLRGRHFSRACRVRYCVPRMPMTFVRAMPTSRPWTIVVRNSVPYRTACT